MDLDLCSRRGFLRAGLVAAAGGMVGSRVSYAMGNGTAAAAGKDGAIRLGVASYSFHQFDRAKVIGFMKQLQCSRLNAKDVHDHLPMSPPEATAKAVADYKAAGIELTAAGVIYFLKPDEADIRQKFEYARRAGVPMIVGSPARSVLSAIEPFVKEFGIRLAIHNHGPEDKEWPSPLDVLKAVEGMDARIGLCIDCGHTARSGTDVVEAIRKTGPRLMDVHIKDLADMKVKESQVAVGEGKMPVREIFAALAGIGYRGNVDLEYEIHDDDPLPGMMKSFAYMRKVAAGLKVG